MAALFFFEKFFSSFFQVTLETISVHINIRSTTQTTLYYEHDYLFIKIAKLDTLLKKRIQKRQNAF